MKILQFKNWKIFNKIILLTAVPIVLFVMVFQLFVLPSIESKLYEEKKVAVHQPVDVVYDIVAGYYNAFLQKKMTENEAKESAKEAVRQLRYNDEDYFWINDFYPNMVLHPI